ncbi:MAG: SRPBCC family protein [Flavobacteriales bacterium]|nr:SRPBCC family protein [Flavobacteriales bacterium]
MKYHVAIDLDLSRDKVIELFMNGENAYHWQEGLESMHVIEGQPGEVGSKTELHFKLGKREITLLETITHKDLPERFDGTYEMDGTWNLVQNRFIELGPDRTRWEGDVEFKFKGFMKVMGWLMPGMFKKQSMKYLTNFKAFAEEGKSVAQS